MMDEKRQVVSQKRGEGQSSRNSDKDWDLQLKYLLCLIGICIKGIEVGEARSWDKERSDERRRPKDAHVLVRTKTETVNLLQDRKATHIAV